MTKNRVGSMAWGRAGGRPRTRTRTTFRPRGDGLEGRALLAIAIGTPLPPTLTVAAPAPITAPVLGTTGLIQAGTFVDQAANLDPNPADYVAVVNWGDGDVSLALVKINGINQQPGATTAQVTGTISASHTYATPGPYAVIVGINRGGGDSNFAVTSSTATGTAIPGARALEQSPIEATAGRSTGQVSVAAFVDPVASINGATQADYQVAINWGDGTGTNPLIDGQSFTNGVGRIVGGGPGGPVGYNAIVDAQGAHTYVKPGTYPVVVAVVRGGVVYSYTTIAHVDGLPVLGSGLLTVAPPTSLAGVPLTSATVASFVDTSYSVAPPAGAYTATIGWGDGTSSAGLVQVVQTIALDQESTSIVNVLGTHTYSNTNSYPVTVTLSRPGQILSGTIFARIT